MRKKSNKKNPNNKAKKIKIDKTVVLPANEGSLQENIQEVVDGGYVPIAPQNNVKIEPQLMKLMWNKNSAETYKDLEPVKKYLELNEKLSNIKLDPKGTNVEEYYNTLVDLYKHKLDLVNGVLLNADDKYKFSFNVPFKFRSCKDRLVTLAKAGNCAEETMGMIKRLGKGTLKKVLAGREGCEGAIYRELDRGECRGKGLNKKGGRKKRNKSGGKRKSKNYAYYDKKTTRRKLKKAKRRYERKIKKAKKKLKRSKMMKVARSRLFPVDIKFMK